MKIIKSLQKPVLVLLSITLFVGCAQKTTSSRIAFPSGAPDYSQQKFWAALPQMADPSDSIPEPLQKEYVKDSSVDVFFIHPTSFTDRKSAEWNASLADSSLNRKTDGSSILYQASVFNAYNVYAPRYRQANIIAYFTKDTVDAVKAFDLAYSDVKAAFLYYMEHYNQGKPIILASHSQGTTHAKRLLKELFEGKELEHKLVAAYILGMAVEPDYFSALQPCRDSIQTSCFISWRTFRKGYEPDYQASSRQSVVVNPLNWKTDTAYAPASLHKGAVLINFNRVEPAVDDAQVYKDLLWISRPKFPHSRLYKARNYHIGDFNLFYLNIRENAALRVTRYKQHI